MGKRTFTQLKKSMTLRQFNLFCRDIANEYAFSGLFLARTHFTTTYNITESCYQKIKDYAVTHYLISDYGVDLMESKSVGNQARSARVEGWSSNKHYAKLREERKKFVFEIAEEYIEHPEMTLGQLIESRGRNPEGYYYMLYIAFVGDYGVTFEMAKKMVARMFNDCPSEDKCITLCAIVETFWSERNARKKGRTQ